MTLEIGQLTLKCRAPLELGSDDIRARQFLDRLLQAVRQGLAPSLARGLADLDREPRVVFIESLDFDLTINLDHPAEEIAERIARQLASRLWTKLSDPNVISFSDPVELSATFILDVVTGAAYTRSWHEEFAGLKTLGASGIVRTLIETQPRHIGAALSRLTRSDLARTLNSLEPPDAHRAVAALAGSAENPCRDPDLIASALLALECWRIDEPRDRLALLIELRRQGQADGDSVTLQLADMLCGLGEGLSESIDPSAAREDSVTPGSEPLATEARDVNGGSLRAKRAAAIEAAREQMKWGRELTSMAAASTRLGGLWLVLPHLLELLSGTDLPHRREQTALWFAFAFGALAVSSGPAVQEVWGDRGLRSILGISFEDDELLASTADGLGEPHEPHEPIQAFAVRFRAGGRAQAFGAGVPDDIRRPMRVCRADFVELLEAGAQMKFPRELTRIFAVLGYRALRMYARRLPGFGGSSNAHLWRNFLSTPGDVWSEGEVIRVLLRAPRLDVIWRISGSGRSKYRLPDGRTVIVDVRL